MKKLLPLLLVACGGGRPASAPATLPSTDPGMVPSAASDDTTDTRATPPPAQAVGNPRNDLIPRHVLFGNPERANVKLSPDGKHLSWIAPVGGVMNLHVAPIDKLDQAKVLTKETKRPLRAYAWSFTGKHLVYRQDVGGDENFHVWRVSLDGEVTDLTPYPGARADIAGLSEKKPGSILVSVNNRDPKVMDLHEIDLATGKSTLLEQNDRGFASYTTDDKLAVRFASKKEADGSTTVFAKDKAGWTEFMKIPFEDDSTQLVGVVGNTIYALDSRGRDTTALVTLDPKTKKAKVLAEDARADASDVISHPTKHTPQAVAFNYLKEDWKVLDRAIATDLAVLKKLEGGEITVASRTLDDKTWLVVSTTEQKPGRYYLYDNTKNKATFLFAVQPALESQPLVKMHPVEIKARDGLTLVSYLTLPAAADPEGDGTANQPVPMVLLVHGGPWGRDAWGYNPYHQLLANRGYAVLSVNFRASTGFGKKFLNAGNQQWGKAMHTDLLDAVNWAVEQKVTPKDKVCIMGGSYGGYATLAGLAMTPDVFACGVDIVGPSNLMTLLASIPPYWAPILSMFHERMGNPNTPEGKQVLVEASPLTHAQHIRRPLLIAQGANDPRVKQAESEQIVAAMKKHKLPVTYALFPDEGHGFARPENNIAFVAITEAFLSAHLGGVYQPVSAEELSASTMKLVEGKAGIPGL